jgi:4-amino-4-deoxy-L-arabinose transferase-like glycosyltransferase
LQEWSVLKKRINPGNGVIALLLSSLTAIILTVTNPAIGLTWDEPAYISSSESYTGWFDALVKNPSSAFTDQTITRYWSATHEHPPFDRVWSGMIWSLTRNFLDDLTAHRLGNILLVAVMVGLLYLLVAKSYGKPAGLFAAVGLMLMPRFFFHAHLAALDMPVTVGMFITTFIFWKTVDRKEWWWGLVLGVAWGLAESIKLNATFLPIALVLWTLIFRRKWYMALRIFLMGIGAVATFFAVWPWLYHHTWPRILEYVDFHQHHFDIGGYYFGQYYVPPPWPFVFVMTFLVVPLTVLLLSFIGMARARRGKQDNGLGWLLIISALVPLLVFPLGKTLVYDNERLFMPMFPFLAALAGVGFGWVLVWLRKLLERVSRVDLYMPVGIVVGILCMLPQTITASRLYPHLLSYYSEGVGGLPGAIRLGFETTYWCESYAAAIPYINEHAKPGDRVWVEPWSYDVMFYYQMHGILRSDVKILNNFPGSQSIFGPTAPIPAYGEYFTANWIVVEYRQSQFAQMGGSVPYLLAYLEGQKPPVYQVTYEGIPIMQLYQR